MDAPLFRVVLSCAALAGCNQIFGLSGTHAAPVTDAQFFDGVPDAPFGCPVAGSGNLPAFNDRFIQLAPMDTCENYTTSLPAGNIAVATCAVPNDQTGTQQLLTSAIDGVTMNVAPMTPFWPDGKLSPEGDELWVVRTGPSGSNGLLSVYVPDGSGGWKPGYDAFTTPFAYSAPSTPMQKGLGTRRTLYSDTNGVHELDENPPGTWTEIPGRLYTIQTFGVGDIHSVPQLSPDGLRVVFAGSTDTIHSSVYYADRADLSQPFGVAAPVVGPPSDGAYPFMTYDCSRVYFAGLSSIFYVVEQR